MLVLPLVVYMFSSSGGVEGFAATIPQFLSIAERGTLAEITSMLMLILGNNGMFYALKKFYFNFFVSPVLILTRSDEVKLSALCFGNFLNHNEILLEIARDG